MHSNLKINSLTSLRFFAALFVFFNHSNIAANPSSLLQKLYEPMAYGYSGVSFFFILSGFIISYSYQDKIKNKETSICDFYAFRLIRIYPVHFITFFVFAFSFATYNGSAVLPNLLLLHSLIPDAATYYSFNSVSWSLSAEMVFYLVFPLLAARKSSTLFVLLALILAVYLGTYQLNYFISNDERWMYYVNPAFRMTDFVIGVCLYRMYRTHGASWGYVKATSIELLSVISFIITIAVVVNYDVPQEYKWGLVFIPAMSLIVYSFSHGAGFLSVALSNKYLVLLGDASFSFYMIHVFIIKIGREIIPLATSNYISVLVQIAVCLLVSIAFSVIMFKYIEYPFNLFLKRKWNARRKVTGLAEQPK